MAKRTLILGGTGPLGSLLCNALLKVGHFVYLFNRGSKIECPVNGVRLIKGDRQSIKDLNQLEDVEVDDVIDTLGWYSETQSYILQKLAQRIRRYIFISSIAVYGGKEGVIYKEEDADENTNPIWGVIGQQKRACEVILERAYEGGFNAVILRLSHLYGFWGHQSRERVLLDALLQGREIYIPDTGNAKLQFVHIEDVVGICKEIVDEKNSAFRYHNCYNLSSDRVWTIKGWVRQCAEWAGVEAKVKLYEYRSNNKSMFIYLPGNVIVDTGLIKRDFGDKLLCPDNTVMSKGS